MALEYFDLGTVNLQYGGELPAAKLAYETHGTLNANKDNVVLFPTWCAGNHEGVRWVIGPQWALDPNKYFIVVANMFGNGVSSSPSNTPKPYDRTRFPHVSVLDNAKFQHRLITEKFGARRVRLVVGRSMGGQLAFQWGAYFPEMVDNILSLAGAARTAPHSLIFLATMKMAITSPPEWQNGEYMSNPEQCLKNFRLNADAWGFSREFYRQNIHLKTGFKTTQDYLERPGPYSFADANDLLAQFRTWEACDISDNEKYKKDFTAALKAIKARGIIMPSKTDLYFPPEDNAYEVASMPNAELRVMPSIWGHRGGSPGSDPADIAFFDKAIADLLVT